MKTAFVSIAALAASAFAAPLDARAGGLPIIGDLIPSAPTGDVPTGDLPAGGDVGKAIGGIDQILTGELGLGEIAGKVGKTNPVPTKRALTDTTGLAGLLSGVLNTVTGQTDLLSMLLFIQRQHGSVALTTS